MPRAAQQDQNHSRIRQRERVSTSFMHPAEFSLLSARAAEWLASAGELLHLPRGGTLQHEGVAADYAYYVIQGLLYAGYHVSAEEAVVTELIGAKRLILEGIFLEGPQREVRSISACSMLRWPKDSFKRAAEDSPRFTMWLLKQALEENRQREFHKARQSTLSLEAKYAHLLWTLAEPAQAGCRRLTVKIPQQLMASYLDITREEVSRKKQMLERAGYLWQEPDGLVLSAQLPRLFQAQCAYHMPWVPEVPGAEGR